MKKVRIDLAPKDITFEREVSIPTSDGSDLKLCFAFRHRTRTEFAAFTQPRLERLHVLAQQAIAQEEARLRGEIAGAKDLLAMAEEANLRNADSILQMASDWGIEGEEFTRENVARFCNLYPGAEDAIFEDYRRGMLEGRLGN